ncbi:hypothetical protein FACS1894172_12740 [Spirochaetia bacterium]|nr:hypothetical protein FACS1894172_12740 [Spirochaetia bacterium]
MSLLHVDTAYTIGFCRGYIKRTAVSNNSVYGIIPKSTFNDGNWVCSGIRFDVQYGCWTS